MSDRRRSSIGRSTMEIALGEVRARNDELARLRERHELLRRRLSRRMHALRNGDLVGATTDRVTPVSDEAMAWSDDDETLGDDDEVDRPEEGRMAR
jgi:hypothetical protein